MVNEYLSTDSFERRRRKKITSVNNVYCMLRHRNDSQAKIIMYPLVNRLLFEWQMIVNKSTNDRTQIKQNPSNKLSLRHLHLLYFVYTCYGCCYVYHFFLFLAVFFRLQFVLVRAHNDSMFGKAITQHTMWTHI